MKCAKMWMGIVSIFEPLRQSASIPYVESGKIELTTQSQATDLFGHTRVQGDLFGSDAAVIERAPQVDPAMVRRRLMAMLSDIRSAEKKSPWPPETTRLNQLLFPQMANWLPEEERDQLRFEFETELKRLNLAA